MKNQGQLFEEQFRASVPAWAECQKLNSPVPPVGRVEGIITFLRTASRLSSYSIPNWIIPQLDRLKFTPPQPYDLILSAPCSWPTGEYEGPTLADPTGSPVRLRSRPRVDFRLEIKSAGAGNKSLPFDRVKPHQEKGLLKAARAGMVAGLVVEFPVVEEVWFLPVELYLAVKAACGRKSLSLEDAQRVGQPILVDPYRGRSKTYWQVGEWMRSWGAGEGEQEPEP